MFKSFTKPSTNLNVLFAGYLFSAVALFFYTFTQIDLSLTLSRSSIFQQIEKSFQYIGYFNRPLSTYLFVGILLLLFFFYIRFLSAAEKKIVTKRQVWSVIIISAVLLGISYSAFSYDIFNYIFDAKILTQYHQNPYLQKALDYPGDPMLSFMHWTHRTYPYGLVWLGISSVASFIGFQYFPLTFFLFKLLAIVAYLGCIYFIGKIAKEMHMNELLSMVLFGFNPLVLLEGLVSAHNDIVMMFFGLLGFWLLLNKKYIFATISFIAFYGIKLATPEISPVFHGIVVVLIVLGVGIFRYIREKNASSILLKHLLFLFCIPMVALVILASIRTNFQPWYLLYLLPFVSLLRPKYFVIVPTIIMTFFAALEYVPYLYLGNWDPPVPTVLFYLTTTGVVLSFMSILLIRLIKGIQIKNGKN